MNKAIRKHIISSIVILFIQIFLLKNINPQGWLVYTSFYIYPLVLILAPLNINRSLFILIAFLVGLFIDLFYGTPGLHASACVFTAFLKNIILRILRPTDGFKSEQVSIMQLGLVWIFSFVAIMLGVHMIWYFSMDAFSFVYINDIFLRSAQSFLASFLVCVMYLFIFNLR